MKPWLWMTLCLGCLAVAGCRTNQARTMLERESRQWEEQYYIAQDRLEECQCMLDAALGSDRELEKPAGRFGPSGSPTAGKTPADMAPPSIQGLSEDRFQKSPPASFKSEPPSGLEEVEPPANSLPDQPDADSIAPPYNPGPAIKLPGGNSDQKSMPEAPRFQPPGPKSPAPKSPLSLSGDSREVAHVELIGMSSDGFNADGRPGDEGIQFVLQPRDGDGRPIAATGPVSVVVVDPLPAGKSVRVARWDLSARQTAGYLDRSPQGFHFRLPWPSTEPKHSRLRLFTRYTTSDGRVIEAAKAIEVNLPGQQAPARAIARPPRQTNQQIAQQAAPPDRPRVAAAQPRQSKPSSQRPTSRQRPVWSPERH